MRTPWGITLPPGGRVAAYLRSTGAQSGDDITIGNNLVTTLAQALARVRSGAGDTIVALPGHAENVTTTPTWVAGTRLIGVKCGTATPTFTWSATSSQWAINVANVTVTGCKLAVCGAVVVKGILVTGAGCTFLDNEIVQATGASLKATILMETDTGADNFTFASNYIYGTATHQSDDVLAIKGATVNNRLIGNVAICSSTAVTKGIFSIAGASLNGLIADNYLYNTHTASTVCVHFADVASDGLCVNNRFGCKLGSGGAGPAVTGVLITGSSSLYVFNENYSTPTKGTSGLVTPAVDS
jgi:hypothetical protein